MQIPLEIAWLTGEMEISIKQTFVIVSPTNILNNHKFINNIMFKQYLAHLQLRIDGLNKLLGNTTELKESDVKEVRDGINEITTKLHKDNNRKFQRIKRSIEKYSLVIDTLPVQQKMTFVNAFIEELHEIAAQLTRIQQLLPALNTDNYIKFRNEYKNLWLLDTCSQVEESVSEKVVAKQINDEPLTNLRIEHRQKINDLVQLNAQMITNLSSKIQALKNRSLKQEGVA